jgi:hypothetical protein
MISKRLERLLLDLTTRGAADLVTRFQALRELRLLPTSRGKNADDLSTAEVAAGILSVVAERPGYAALSVKMLRGLMPVGGEVASFRGAPYFGKALEELLISREALDALLEVRVTDSEVGMNSSGRAAIFYRDPSGTERVAWFVRREAVSLLQPGAERAFEPRDALHQTLIETVFYKKVFRRIHAELEREREHAEAMGETQEETGMFCVECGEVGVTAEDRPRTDDCVLTCEDGHAVAVTRTAWPAFHKLDWRQQRDAYVRAKEGVAEDEMPVIHTGHLH